MNLPTNSHQLRLTTSSSAAVTCVVSFADSENGTTLEPGLQTTSIASATTATILNSPAAGKQRGVSDISIVAGGTVSVTPKVYDGTTNYTLFGPIALVSGESVHWITGRGWFVLDATGAVKQTGGGGGGGGGLVDGSYGDVTVSGGGTVMTINPSAVAMSEIDNTSAGPGTTLEDVLTAYADSSGIDNASGVTGVKITDALNTLNSSKAAASHTHVPADVTMTNGYAVLGRSSGAGGSTTELVPGSANKALAFDGTSTGFKELTGAYLANNSIDVGKLGPMATDVLVGRSSVGSGPAELITLTAAGRALLDDVDAAAQRSTLGLGTAATSAASSFAAASHTHAAADITSGVLNTARMGSGTADDTKFLRGDGTWANGLNDLFTAPEVRADVLQSETNNGLAMRGASSSFYYIFQMLGSPVATRTWNIDLGDADRSFTMSGDLNVTSSATVSGTNTGDQNLLISPQAVSAFG